MTTHLQPECRSPLLIKSSNNPTYHHLPNPLLLSPFRPHQSPTNTHSPPEPNSHANGNCCNEIISTRLKSPSLPPPLPPLLDDNNNRDVQVHCNSLGNDFIFSPLLLSPHDDNKIVLDSKGKNGVVQNVQQQPNKAIDCTARSQEVREQQKHILSPPSPSPRVHQEVVIVFSSNDGDGGGQSYAYQTPNEAVDSYCKQNESMSVTTTKDLNYPSSSLSSPPTSSFPTSSELPTSHLLPQSPDLLSIANMFPPTSTTDFTSSFSLNSPSFFESFSRNSPNVGQRLWSLSGSASHYLDLDPIMSTSTDTVTNKTTSKPFTLWSTIENVSPKNSIKNYPGILEPSVTTSTTSITSTNNVQHQRQHSSADSSYNSDDEGDGGEDGGDDEESNVFCDLAKIVGDIVDSGNFNPNKPEKRAAIAKNVDFKHAPETNSNKEHHLWTTSQNLRPTNLTHEEVNRTTSETLSQEYSEWSTSPVNQSSFQKMAQPESFFLSKPEVTFEKHEYIRTTFSPNSSNTFSTSSSSSCSLENLSELASESEVLFTNPENFALYSEKLKYSLKLGYTEEQVVLAIKKVGVAAAKNDFLNALIRIGATIANEPTESEQVSTKNTSYLTSSLSLPPTVFSEQPPQLRPIVIDGSNVAISHGNKEVFSCRGIQLAIEWFQKRGHREITAFVPMWRKAGGSQATSGEFSRFDMPVKNRHLLLQMEAERLLVFTPSRNVSGRLIASYDDRYVLNLAIKNSGIIVSNDQYRDLVGDNLEYRKAVEERLLMFSFVGDEFMPPDDPLGKRGPSLDEFLKFPSTSGSVSTLFQQPCPYEKKCTYGNKCKYLHPEKNASFGNPSTLNHKSVADILGVHTSSTGEGASNCKPTKSALKLQQSLPVNFHSNGGNTSVTLSKPVVKQSLCRTQSSAVPSNTSYLVVASNDGFNDRGRSFSVNSGLKVPNIQFSQQQKVDTKRVQPQLHKKLERQLTLNPYGLTNSQTSNIIQKPVTHKQTNINFSQNLGVPSTLSKTTLSPSSSPTPPSLSPKSKLQQTKSWGCSTSSHFDNNNLSNSFQPPSRTISKSSRALNELQHLSNQFQPNQNAPFHHQTPKMLLNDVTLLLSPPTQPKTHSKSPLVKSQSSSATMQLSPSTVNRNYFQNQYQHLQQPTPFLSVVPPLPVGQQQEFLQQQRLHQMLHAINEQANEAVLAAATSAVQQQVCHNYHSNPQNQALHHHQPQIIHRKISSTAHPALQQSHSTSSITSTQSFSQHQSTNGHFLAVSGQLSLPSLSTGVFTSKTKSTVSTKSISSNNFKGSVSKETNLQPSFSTYHSRPGLNEHILKSTSTLSTFQNHPIYHHNSVTRNHSEPFESSGNNNHTVQASTDQSSQLNFNSVPFNSSDFMKSTSNHHSRDQFYLSSHLKTESSPATSSLSSSFSSPTITSTTTSNVNKNVWSYDQQSSATENAASWDVALKPTNESSKNSQQNETSLHEEKIFFHLSAIFPEDQVRQAMASLPPGKPLDAQQVCSQILAMQTFNKNHLSENF